MKKVSCLWIAVLCCCATALAQQSKVPVYTADSISSGNTKDIIASFFQLGLNNLTGKNREFNFNASPYAIMLKNKPQLAIDSNYKKNAFWRSLNIGFGLKLDSAFNYNGFTSSVKIKLIDKTDITTSKILKERATVSELYKERGQLNHFVAAYKSTTWKPPADTTTQEYQDLKLLQKNIDNFSRGKPFAQLDKAAKELIRALLLEKHLKNFSDHLDANLERTLVSPPIAQQDAASQERRRLDTLMADYIRDTLRNIPRDSNSPIVKAKADFQKKFNSLVVDDKKFNSFDADFQAAIMKLVKDKNLKKVEDVFINKADSSFYDLDKARFEALKNEMKKNLLWTFSVSDTTYKDKFDIANVSLVTEISKGLFSPKPGENNLEFTGKAAYNLMNDSLQAGRNLKRQLFTAEAGLNWVWRDKETDRSFLEAKFSSTYYHNFAGLYANEKRDLLTLNGTLRFRVKDDIWIPVEVRYDPTNGNLFGFLNVKANFTGLAKALK